MASDLEDTVRASASVDLAANTASRESVVASVENSPSVARDLASVARYSVSVEIERKRIHD